MFRILLILVLFNATLSAQSYHPFPTKNALWTEMYYKPYPNYGSIFHSYRLNDNDTVIEGKVYHKLYHSKDTVFSEEDLCGGLREENKRIYYYSLKKITYGLYIPIAEKKEVLIYDFNLKLGDTIRSNLFLISHPDELIVTKVDSVFIDNTYRRRLYFGYPLNETLSFCSWIEGIGYSRGLLFALGAIPTNGLWNDVICFKQESQFLYQFRPDYYDNCYYKLADNIVNTNVENDITLSPNPMEDFGILNFHKDQFDVMILSDMNGKIIKKVKIKGQTTFKITRDKIPSGIYIIQLVCGNGNTKIIKAIFE